MKKKLVFAVAIVAAGAAFAGEFKAGFARADKIGRAHV